MAHELRRALVMAVAATSLVAGFAGAVQAAAQPAPFPQETRLISFVYDEHQTYDVLTRPGAITDIRLADGETMSAFALGDTVQWVFDQAPGHVFVKPVRPGLFTSATLVTNIRTYQLQLRSMPSDGNWYQQVTWSYPNIIVARQAEQKKLADMEAGEVHASPDKLNFSYKVSGRSDFAPSSVFDDGRFTWMRMPDGIQDTPAVFLREEGKLTLVNYSQRGNYLVVQRLADEFILKVGEREVVVASSKRRFSNTGSSFSPLEW